MQIEDIRKVLIIGSGTMGQQIGFQCAMSGFAVTLYDVKAEALPAARDRIAKLAKSYLSAGRLTQAEMDASLARMQFTTDPQAAGKDADFVSESVFEDPELKGKVFSRFNAICPPHTIFTTNTSSLVPSMFAEATGRPEKFAAFHFHDVRFTRIVDIMPHPGTAPETVALIQAFAEKIGQVAIVLKKENYGYVFNAMLMELLRSAQTLAANEVASVDDIDRAFMGVMHTAIGPFGLMDSIGIDTVFKVTDYWARALNDPQALANAAFLKPYVDRGDLGVKTGRGFYGYPDPAFTRPGFTEGKPQEKEE